MTDSVLQFITCVILWRQKQILNIIDSFIQWTQITRVESQAVWRRKAESDLVWIRNIQKICQNPYIVHTYIVHYRENRRNQLLYRLHLSFFPVVRESKCRLILINNYSVLCIECMFYPKCWQHRASELLQIEKYAGKNRLWLDLKWWEGKYF